MSNNKNSNSGWGLPNDGLYDRDEDARRRAESEETHGLGRLTDDAIPVFGGLRSKLEEMANSGNRDVIAILEENGIENPRIPKTFYLATGQAATIYGEKNLWHAVVVLNGKELTFTNPDRDTCMAQASSFADRNRDPRALTSTERYHVAQLAQADPGRAIVEYLRYRLGEEALNQDERDPRHRHVYDECAYDIFRWHENSYISDPVFEQLLARIAADKPLTVKLVQTLYTKYIKEKPALSARQVAHDVPEPEQPLTEVDLEKLSDKDISDLRTSALQERGRRVRAFDSAMGVR